MMAMRRVRMLPSPGRAISDSGGELFTSGLELRGTTASCAFGTSIPRPSATAAASPASTFASCETTRSRIAGTCTLVSSKRNARTMCACSTGVWL